MKDVDWPDPMNVQWQLGPEGLAKVRELVGAENARQHEQSRYLRRLFTKILDVDPRLASFALLIFSEQERAANWFRKDCRALGGQSPLQVLAEARREEVVQVLGRIRHGVFS